MIPPPKFKKVLSTAHLTLITLSSLFALIIFVISLFTFATLPLGLDAASAAVTILFHLVIIILSWRRSLNSQIVSTPTSKSSFSSPTTSPVLALPATGAALTIIIFLLPLWIIAFAAQIFDVLDPKSPNKTQANQSLQLTTPSGRILGTDDDDQGFGQMLSLALVVCEAVEVVVIFGLIVYGVSVRRKWRMEKEKAGIKSLMLSPRARDSEKGYSPDRQRVEPALEPASATSPINAIKRITQHFTMKPSEKRDLRKAPFPVRGPANPAQATSAPPAASPIAVESSPTMSPKVTGTVPASRASQISQESRFSRLASAVNPIKGFKRPGRAWSYLTPGRPSMMFGETPIETAVDNSARPNPFGSRRVTGQSGYLQSGHPRTAVAASAVDSLYALYEDDKAAQDAQPLPIPVPGTKLPNYIHRQPTGPRTRMTGSGEQIKETFGGVVKVKAPRPPKKVHAQIGRIVE